MSQSSQPALTRSPAVFASSHSSEIEERYGIGAEKLDGIEEDAARGVLPGEPGPVSAGRPLKFGTMSQKVCPFDSSGFVTHLPTRAASGPSA